MQHNINASVLEAVYGMESAIQFIKNELENDSSNTNELLLMFQAIELAAIVVQAAFKIQAEK